MSPESEYYHQNRFQRRNVRPYRRAELDRMIYYTTCVVCSFLGTFKPPGDRVRNRNSSQE